MSCSSIITVTLPLESIAPAKINAAAEKSLGILILLQEYLLGSILNILLFRVTNPLNLLIIKRVESIYGSDTIGSSNLTLVSVSALEHEINKDDIIYYVNSNNGYTLFKASKKKVESVENRLVIFPTNLEHCGVSCTDNKQRIVINFNYSTPIRK